MDLYAPSLRIWDERYRLRRLDGKVVDETVEGTWQRIAKTLASVEKMPGWEDKFYQALEGFKFLPAGRIVAGAGAGRDGVTMMNCFVMGTIDDSMEGIFQSLKESALTMKAGGGIGMDFSTLRPNGAPVLGVESSASGPLSFMDTWNAMCKTVISAGARRGAMMGVMRCDHPDIEAFIEAKREPGRLRMFNMSVLITDEFMEAVKSDRPWHLMFGDKVYRTVSARELWDKIMRSTYEYAEPGVIFIDRINAMNNLAYCENIASTNPCGEQPLPPYGQCLLGSINLAAFVRDPFTAHAKIHVPAICDVVRTAVRMMDNVIEVTRYPLEQQRDEAFAKRRLGLGVTGWADALIMRGVIYGTEEACRMADGIMGQIKLAAYDASIELAKEKGRFPLFDEHYITSEFIKSFPCWYHDRLGKDGIRNSHLLSIAPTGTISYFADYVSSGIEPVFEFTHERKVLMPDGSRRTETVEDYAYRLYKKIVGKEPNLSDPLWTSAQNLSFKAHLHTIAAFQKHVDSAISKTINVPKDYPYEDFVKVYLDAYELGCKGCTTYRPNETTGSVLSVKSDQNVTDSSADQQPSHDLPARPIALRGTTYKYRWGDHAYYLTINDEEGTGRPYEVFLNSKDVSSFPWVVALTRMISSIFRYSASLGNDVSFVAEELQAVFDPNGGTWQNGDGRSTYVPSMPAMIGRLIGQHIVAVSPPSDTELAEKVTNAWFQMKPRVEGMISSFEPRKGKQCPKCGHPTLVRSEGCDHCLDCEYSSCE